jgi:O-antigen/teichoic acid export membrane protein
LTPDTPRGTATALRGAFTQIAAQIFIACGSFAVLKLLSSTLGPKSYGIFGIVMALVGIATLFTDLGVNAITPRELVKFPARAGKIIADNVLFRLLLCVFIIPLTVLVAYFLYPRLHSTVPVLTLIAGVLLISDSVRAVHLAYFTATGRNYVVAGVFLLQQLLIVGGAVAVFSYGAGLITAVLTYVVANLIGAALSGFLVRRELRVDFNFGVGGWIRTLPDSLPLGITQAVAVLLLRVDSVILAIYLSPAQVAPYFVAYAFINSVNTVPGYMMSAIMPSLVRSEGVERQHLLNLASRYAALLGGLVVAVLVSCAGPLVVLVAGTAFSGGVLPLQILAVASLFTFLNAPNGLAAVSANVHHRLFFVTITALVVNVGANLLLIPALGITGAAAATLCSEILVLILTRAYLARRGREVISVLAPLGVATIGATIAIVVTMFGRSFLVPRSSLVDLIVSGVLSSVTFAIIAACYLLVRRRRAARFSAE